MTDDPSGSATAEAYFSGWRFRAVVWSVVIAALAYLALTLWGGRASTLTALGKVGTMGVGVALMLSLVNYGLRFVRWQMYLGAMGAAVPVWPSMQIYLAGFALTTTPAKAGEALRSLFLKGWGVPYSTSLMALLGERMSDVLAILMLSVLGMAAYPEARPMMALGIAVIAFAYLAVSSERLLAGAQSWFVGSGKTSGAVRKVAGMLLHARSCYRPRMLLAATLLSFIAWGAEAWAFHFILQRMGADIALPMAASIYAISMLAGALSFMPGGLGGAEAAMIALLTAAGVDMPQAISATIIIRLATLWFAVAIGALAVSGAARTQGTPVSGV